MKKPTSADIKDWLIGAGMITIGIVLPILIVMFTWS